MRNTRRRGARVAVALLTTATLSAPMVAPASAHGRLPARNYSCYIVAPFIGALDANVDVRIKSGRRYAYRVDGERLGGGLFRHPNGSRKIDFRGYLRKQDITGRHLRSRTRPRHAIELSLPVETGESSYTCIPD